jgi:pyruvate dehydrogenase E1 component alpha subunit
MPVTIIHEAKTERLEILDRSGKADEALLPKLSSEEMANLYKLMVRMRRFDEKALTLQRQGRMGTWGSIRGQEACQAGLAVNLLKEDWLAPSFREHGVMISRGIPMRQVYAIWRGDERGHLFPEGVNCLPVSIPVASQLLHAAGLGLGLKLRGEKSAVAIGFAGDGASSEGDFHEALNFAGVFKSRTLFFIQNNQWAISLPFKKQTAAESIAQRAHGYGMPGMQVDGNDVLAVYAATKKALDHVRAGNGPYLLECLTYRMENHTTADDATRYRLADEIAYWKERDPIDRMRAFLVSKKLWNDQKEAALFEEVSAEVEAEVKALEAEPSAPATDIVDFMYKERPWFLEEQRALLAKEAR